MTAEEQQPVDIEPDDSRLTMLEHLSELRWRLVKVAAALIVGAVVGWFLVDVVTDILRAPHSQAFPGQDLTGFRPAEGFSVAIRMSFFIGFILASPIVFYQAWAFISPGLTKREKRWTIPVVSALVILFVGGVSFAYVTLPRALIFLRDVLDIEFTIGINFYLEFVTRFLLVFGLAFQYPVFLYGAAAIGVVSHERLAQGRRWAVLIITIVAAAATPTGDPFTMLLLAGPLYLMYEATLVLIKLTLRRS